MGVESAAVNVVTVAPNHFEKVIAILWLTRALTQEKQEFELGGGQRHGLLVEVEGEAVFIEAERAEGEDDRTGGGAVAFDDGLDPQDELLGTEGLGEVVIGTHFEALDTIIDLALRGQHEDWNGVGPGVSLHFLENLVAVHPRKHEVQNDKIGLIFEDSFQSFTAVVNNVYFVSCSLEIEGNEVCDVDFIFDNQNVFHG